MGNSLKGYIGVSKPTAIRIYCLQTHKVTHTIDVKDVCAQIMIEDSLYLGGDSFSGISVYNIKSGKHTKTIDVSIGKVTILIYLGDHHLLCVGGNSGKILVVDTKQGKEIETITVDEGYTTTLYAIDKKTFISNRFEKKELVISEIGKKDPVKVVEIKESVDAINSITRYNDHSVLVVFDKSKICIFDFIKFEYKILDFGTLEIKKYLLSAYYCEKKDILMFLNMDSMYYFHMKSGTPEMIEDPPTFRAIKDVGTVGNYIPWRQQYIKVSEDEALFFDRDTTYYYNLENYEQSVLISAGADPCCSFINLK